MSEKKAIAETNNFIGLDKYTKIDQQGGGYQTESGLEQELIVTILNKFDTLTTSFTSGLSCKIELRQKQYEYYREKLLAFKAIET